MSVEVATTVLHQFLSNTNLDVLALTGEWGVGKTHAWKSALISRKGAIKFDSYAYVSLFGIASIAEFRTALVLQSMAVKNVGSTLDFDSINENWASRTGELLKRNFSRLKSLAKVLPNGANISLGLEGFLPTSVRNSLVCIDDLERSTLKAEDVLGVISELKEERGCKVALIFNNDALQTPEIFLRFKEKVIDYELRYAPTAEESFDLAFSSSHARRDLIKQHTTALEIRNIRILRRIRNILLTIESALVQTPEPVWEQIIASTVLLCWAAYGVDPSRPNIREIHTWNEKLLTLRRHGEPDDPAWVTRIKAYGFAHVDDVDLAIALVVERGYVEGTGLVGHVAKLSLVHEHAEREAALTQVWNEFHGSFSGDHEGFASRLHNATLKALDYISVGNLNGAVVVLRQLSKDALAEDLISRFLVVRKDDQGTFDLSENPFGGSVNDENLRKALDGAHSVQRKLPSLSEAMEYMTRNAGYNDEHLEAVKLASADDFYNLFMNPPSGVRLPSLIKRTLRFDGGENADIGIKVREALGRIKASSLLNKIRIERYGV